MTPRQDPLERVRAANPVPAAAEPDWERVTEHVANGQPESLEVDRGRGVRRTLLGGLAFCVAVAAAVLIALAPWSGSSGFLARAAAALTPPGPGSVLYERWEHIVSERGNPVFGDAATFGPEQLWIEGASPRRYRAVLEANDNLRYDSSERTDLAFTYGVDVAYSGYTTNWLTRLPRKLAGRPLELGGELEAPTNKAHPDIVSPTLTFVPSNELFRARLRVALGASLPGPHDQIIETDPDPVSVLRAAIVEGRAHEAGVTDREGLNLLRIDLDLSKQPPAGAPPLPANAPVFHREAYAYVEPETFRPVEIVYGRDTYRFLAYEYLPASVANRALTDIRAQHPTAAIVSAATKLQLKRTLVPGSKTAVQHRQ